MNALLSPEQIELITSAWAESSPLKLSIKSIEMAFTDIKGCFMNWSVNDLAASSETAIEDNLLTALAKQTYLRKSHSPNSAKLLINLISSFRLALMAEGLTNFNTPNKRLNSSTDWLSIGSIDARDYLIGKNIHKLFDSSFLSRYRAYSDGTDEPRDIGPNKPISNLDIRIVNSSISYMDHNRVTVKSCRLEYSCEMSNTNLAGSLGIILAYDKCRYRLFDEDALLSRIVELNAIATHAEPKISSYMVQCIGRSLSSDKSHDWSDFSGLPAISTYPLFHLGRVHPFYACIMPSDSLTIADISRASLLKQDLTYLGMLDTFGSVHYSNTWEHGKNKHLDHPVNNTKVSPLYVKQQSILPGVSAEIEGSPQGGANQDADWPHFLSRALNGSSFLHAETKRALKSQADMGSLRYLIECGEHHSNLNGEVVNGSFLVSDDLKIRMVWRYEPNFNSWSGKMLDSYRTMCRIFMYHGEMGNQDGFITELSLMDFPDDTWIEDLRLFEDNGRLLATAALFSPSPLLNQVTTANNLHNTGTGMLVSQCLVEIDTQNSIARLAGFLNLRKTSDSTVPSIPTNFEKNWAISNSSSENKLIYSIEPWLIFRGTVDNCYNLDAELAIRPSIKSKLGAIPRISCHTCCLPKKILGVDASIGFFHTRDQNYSYNQYLYALDNATGRPLGWNSRPFLCLDSDFTAHDYLPPEARVKNKGVCYISSITILKSNLLIMVNMFDSELYILSVSLEYAISLLASDADGYQSIDFV